LLVGLTAGTLPAASGDVKTVSYSQGKQGSRLKWLPYRPSAGNPLGEPTGRVTPASALTPVQRKLPRAFADPFGDQRAEPQPPRLPGTLGDDLPSDLPSEPPEEPLTEEPLPGLPFTEPLAEPYAPGARARELLAPEEELGLEIQEKCPLPDDRDFLNPIDKIPTDISAKQGELPSECSLGDKTFHPRAWAPTTFTWQASGLCHKPLYFEDVHLERYGHSWGPHLQPILSGAHFFLTFPVLPYKMGLYPPCECIYTLGYYRPGSCAPYMLDPLPLSVRAGLLEAGAWTGMAYLIP